MPMPHDVLDRYALVTQMRCRCRADGVRLEQRGVDACLLEDELDPFCNPLGGHRLEAVIVGNEEMILVAFGGAPSVGAGCVRSECADGARRRWLGAV